MARRTREAAARAQAMIEATGHGPHLPKDQWHAAMVELHDRGATFGEIARLFEVSAETVRLRLAGLTLRLLTDEEWQYVLARRARLAAPSQGEDDHDQQEPALQAETPGPASTR